ncbi:MAG: alpha/beta fold hydrolase [Halothece sp.]
MLAQEKSQTQFYTWNSYQCAYEVRESNLTNQESPVALLLIHPIGVGLSRRFWDRFSQQWQGDGGVETIYNPDLLGCGETASPRVAYHPEDFAAPLKYLIENIIKKPVVIVSQGASFPITLELLGMTASENIAGLILAGPPAWSIITQPKSARQQRWLWNLFNSPLGGLFYRYARRRQFLESFSVRQLFSQAEDVDQQWLDMLKTGSEDMASRHAVFSFLAGFWRKNYESAIAQITQPTLVLMGETASSISKDSQPEPPQERIDQYCQTLPNGEGKILSGRNVLPYESTTAFTEACQEFLQQFRSLSTSDQ